MAAKSTWNPTGSDTNCMACVARYLYARIKGTELDAQKSDLLEFFSEPETDRGHAATLARQKRNAIIRLVSIMENVGLREADRFDAYLGQTHYAAGHYAVIGLSKGHVIYGRVEAAGNDFAELFCPQTNHNVMLGTLYGQALAIRFV
jgi:hypothetical protein